jgi:hypothetical protein
VKPSLRSALALHAERCLVVTEPPPEQVVTFLWFAARVTVQL